MAKDNSFLYEAKRNGFSLETGFRQVGFVLDSLAASQTSYICVENCNRWLAENFGTNFSIFYTENSIPCIQPAFARFHAKEALAFYGNLIATSFDTAFSIKDATRSKRYYYIQDLEWTRSWFRYSKEELDAVMLDDNIVKFTRSDGHLNEIVKAGYKPNLTVVKDFNIHQILEIVNGTKR